MGDFFHGRRRKAGILTLLVALVFMGLWVRSSRLKDHYGFGSDDSNVYCKLEAYKSGFTWEKTISDKPLLRNFGWWCDPLNERELSGPDDPLYWACEVNWTWRRFGFGGGVAITRYFKVDENGHLELGAGGLGLRDKLASETTFWLIPYWSIVMPLTLLSTCLLLSKSQAPKQPNNPQSAN